MELDYNSFMAGVMTGLKLHRPPAGRKPPAPSGRYILTESGEKIITEYSSSEVTLYRIGQWIPYPEGYSFRGYYRVMCRRQSGNYIPDDPRYYFYGSFTDLGIGVTARVLWVPSGTSIGRYGVDYTSDPNGGQIIDLGIDYSLTPGFDYNNEIKYYYMVPSTYDPVPNDALIYEGAFYEELPRFILGLGSQPMLTE